MPQNIDTLFDTPEFRQLPDAKAAYLKEMLRRMDGRTVQEKIQVLLSYGFKMKNNGLTLSSAETSLLMPMLEKNLSPEEREQLKQITRFL